MTLEKYLKKWLFVHFICDWLYVLLGIVLVLYFVFGVSSIFEVFFAALKVGLLIHMASSFLIVLGDYVYNKPVLIVSNILIGIITIRLGFMVLFG